jgi:hypothetical protein
MAPLLECHEASKHHLLKYWLFPTGSINLGFLLRENLLLCSSYLPLGVPNWVVILPVSPASGNQSGKWGDEADVESGDEATSPQQEA